MPSTLAAPSRTPWLLLEQLAPLFGVRTASGARRACLEAGVPLVRIGRHLAARTADLEAFAARLEPVASARTPLPTPAPPAWAADLLKRKPRGYAELAPKRRRRNG